MSWAAIGAAAATVVGGAIFGDKGGGGGGGVSAKTQGGANEVAFNPVGYETSQISPFEYMQLQKDFDQEQAENMKYGGPLYRGKGGDIATDIFSQGIKDLMPEGIMGILLSSYFLDNEDDEEESIVPGLNDGGGIGSIFQQMAAPDFETDLFDPTALGGENMMVVGGVTNTQASSPEATTPQFSPEEIAADLKTQNRQDMFKQLGKDFATGDLPNLINQRQKQKQSKKSSISGRGNIVPGTGGGGRANRQQRQKTASQGITPFQYREMQGGGALNRQMFMQNYMPNGGDIRGPGGPKDDLIPVMASNGEYMLSKAAVDQAGGGNHARGIANLEQFNNRGNRRYG
jgi:hypothetical protein